MGEKRRSYFKTQLSFRAILLTYSLVMLVIVLVIALALFVGLYRIVDDMQDRIGQYVTINRLANEIADGKEAFTLLFEAIQDPTVSDLTDYVTRFEESQQQALADAALLFVPFEENSDKYFLSKAIINGIDHIGLTAQKLAIPVEEVSAGTFSSYYWGLKVYDYLLDYTYNLYLSAAVSSDIVASLENMAQVSLLKNISIISMFLIIVAYVVTTYMITMRLTRPISSMVKTASDITQGNLDTPDLEVSGPEELYFLEQSMNQMKASLKERMELEKQLHRKELEQVKMTRELERARFQSLQAQINPHFLFNTLNTISRTAMFEEAETTMSLINSLSSIFRYSLEFEDDVELGKALDFVKQYLGIQKARFGDRVAYRLECPTELESVVIPPLVIQPFVENAIVHGLEPLEEGGAVVVRVRRIAARKIEITIEDNGIGIAASSRQKKSNRSHIGISNVRQRLDAYYKGKASLTITRLHEAGGTLVTLILPCKTIRSVQDE